MSTPAAEVTTGNAAAHSGAVAAFAEHARRSAVNIDAALAAYLQRARPLHDDASLLATFDAMQSLALRGGKRWRAALAQLTYAAFAGPAASLQPGIAAGVALELLQTYLLIHDDWMDQDDVRRGAPSVHAALRTAFVGQTGARADEASGTVALGDAAAILAGDFACALAQSALLDAQVAPAALVAACSVFARMQRDVVLGQTLDVLAPLPPEASGADAAWAHIEQVYAWKTGSYTVDGPLTLGAALGGAAPAQLAALQAFARPLGVAFQMADDLLGTFGDPALTGKPRGGDLREGKRTAVVATMAAYPQLRAYYTQLRLGCGLSAQDVDACLRQLQALGIEREVTARLDRECAAAFELLEPLGLPTGTTECLRGAVLSLARRSA